MGELEVSVEQLRDDDEVIAYLKQGDEQLGNLGLTEHGVRHAGLVSDIAANVMRRLELGEECAELAAIAGFLHDIGNVFHRHDHAHVGAVLSHRMLRERNLSPRSTAVVVGAIGNHEERDGQIVSAVGAALVLADKSDVHRSRVRVDDLAQFDIHDRVNYAAERSFLDVNAVEETITLRLEIDTDLSPVMDYFEIFMTRMMMCRRAATFLGQRFSLEINGMRML